MLSLDASSYFRQKDKRHASEQRQPLRDFSQIFRADPRQWTLPSADKSARNALAPPSGARLTLAAMGY